MIVIKKKILLERYRSRKSPLSVKDSVVKVPKGKCKDCGEDEINMQDGYKVDYGWGTITASTIPVRLFITQNMDDMGMFDNEELFDTTPDYSILETEITNNPDYILLITDSKVWSPTTMNINPHDMLSATQKLYLRSSDKVVSDYYASGSRIVGYTDDKLGNVTSLRLSSQYTVNKNRSDDPKNYWSGIKSVNSDKTIFNYTLNADNLDSNKDLSVSLGGTPKANSGIEYTTNKNLLRVISNGKCYGCGDSGFEVKSDKIFSTKMEYKGEGWNVNNIGLSAITKSEMFFGITSPPEVMSDVFIDRGVSSPMEHHLRLNDVGSIEEFSRYGNKFFNIITI